MEKRGVLYLCLYYSLFNRYGCNTLIHRKKIFEKLGRHYLVPNSLKPIVILELINQNLLKQINRNNYQLIESKKDIEKQIKSIRIEHNVF